MHASFSVAQPRRPARRRAGFAVRGRRRAAVAAFTVLEAAIAGALITIFLGSLFALNSNMMRLLASASESASASQALQTRVEQVRLANWTQLTDPNWVQTNLLGSLTDASVNLPGLSETITVRAYISPSTVAAAPLPPAFTVTRDAGGKLSVSPVGYASSAALVNQEMIEIDLTVAWPSWRRSRNRALTTLVSRWGISK